MLTAQAIRRREVDSPLAGEYLWKRLGEVDPGEHVRYLQGRVADWVYLVRNGRQFVRPYTPPSDPRSGYQLQQRERLAAVQREWRTLTVPQRQGWGEAARHVWPHRAKLPLGRIGQNLFTSAQLQRLAWGAPIRHDPPSATLPQDGFFLELLPAKDGVSLRLRVRHNQHRLEGHRLLVEMSPATLTLQRKPTEGKLTRAAQTDGESYLPLQPSGAEYVIAQPRHSVLPGQRFGLRLTIVTDDGLRGTPKSFDLLRV